MKARKGTWEKQTLLRSLDVDLELTQMFLSCKEETNTNAKN